MGRYEIDELEFSERGAKIIIATYVCGMFYLLYNAFW